MFKKLISLLILLLIFSTSTLFAKETDIVPTAKKLVGYIRFKKYDKAIDLIDTKTFCQNLLIKYWDKIDPKEQLEFEEAMKVYIKNKSFTKAVEIFNKIDITYEKPKVNGNQAELPASILYKSSEKVTFAWIFVEKNGKYLVSDFLDSKGVLATKLYGEREIMPTYEKKGMKELIALVKKASK